MSLTLTELRSHVAALPAEALAALRRGPRDAGCGVCEALLPLLPPRPFPGDLHAAALWVWHEAQAEEEQAFFIDPIAQLTMLLGPQVGARLHDAYQPTWGGMVHARCLVLYALALAVPDL